MALVGTLLFCTDCGNLLDREPPNLKKITCKVCQCNNSNRWPLTTQTSSRPDAFPSTLQRKHHGKIQTVDPNDADSWPKTSQTCPRCDNPEMYFREMQLRGADEGSTIFYRCTKCDYMSRTDN
ncbi:hypothetical protein BU26DRAFT_468182 [Trematosphaeria pertusa]|uniref:DNA-directed RNA polymerase subunit n=1 Tax=Trematosphaeria pertusa TaxID=390896 RepID=A0A6A6HWL9_9PLEO|nr:uncharacterized protein BU26DRAFT_468182 [Trematosphaeria pertusa]KAF2242122.1 hypothetical protein BU26DRAFT_468182 [Trematosphaeria pertusa]